MSFNVCNNQRFDSIFPKQCLLKVRSPLTMDRPTDVLRIRMILKSITKTKILASHTLENAFDTNELVFSQPEEYKVLPYVQIDR